MKNMKLPKQYLKICSICSKNDEIKGGKKFSTKLYDEIFTVQKLKIL